MPSSSIAPPAALAPVMGSNTPSFTVVGAWLDLLQPTNAKSATTGNRTPNFRMEPPAAGRRPADGSRRVPPLAARRVARSGWGQQAAKRAGGAAVCRAERLAFFKPSG